MSDDQFRQLCNVYGFAPSRALREMIDCVTASAELAERNAILQMSREQWFKTQADFEEAIRAREKQA